MTLSFTPGDLVRLPTEPGWGLGQVQSAIKGRITVNFEHAGKVVILASEVSLVPAAPHQKDATPEGGWD
jgi:ABC-type uncharacterized transport system YnjBCD ATPase subunit